MDNNTLPNFAFIIPNNINNTHDCKKANKCLDVADAWLKKYIDPLINSREFRNSKSAVIITLDEGEMYDTKYSGGHTAWVIVGPIVKRGYTSDKLYRHDNTLRLISDLLGLNFYPENIASAESM